ncbi:MAG: hypothetical protein A3J07_02870 [Candidatus Doudnabacteria bacterium RIFCSPLOWO2_02_FULL_49_13]|uniref:Uncharacterized protein n=1 Tax=Candidatus Doudnabacteria bacterium RIFCSPHIGHO2_12_FULL_48_16 TaxID=1817838 RepID=A0A1F5PL01_9BACT|nr:MAG: hypothetical protein A3B77_01510 [Candidatus Doudnabacteria bacterium RIFCSPHIGHO2_02_FULL_49_24]OGE90618.1 MAG: hypothetical protein A3E29_02380 [Candidatus Doudnabacteria bacterium RIFCSPHIGHO2_12_FULL_48_16]OGF03012.1 MAG: hypothetical protein A3J07_02870 [Candidatus Doudnabacteria bacterium RIFCSPLOWO2_02_FULL_49_13]OGF03675.1 MAG: hypothetical protein A3H14_02680 [Candidatus Doudnabacteria bacterium RIFCSPLOWO2_12_FULL_49_8]
MALRFKTSDPSKLLSAFKKAIDDGRVVKWSYDEDDDFTHTDDQWQFLAWLRPRETKDGLIFNIISPKNKTVSSEVYAIYHGRFLESMLAHCDSLFSNADATALASKEDFV